MTLPNSWVEKRLIVGIIETNDLPSIRKHHSSPFKFSSNKICVMAVAAHVDSPRREVCIGEDEKRAKVLDNEEPSQAMHGFA